MLQFCGLTGRMPLQVTQLYGAGKKGYMVEFCGLTGGLPCKCLFCGQLVFYTWFLSSVLD